MAVMMPASLSGWAAVWSTSRPPRSEDNPALGADPQHAVPVGVQRGDDLPRREAHRRDDREPVALQVRQPVVGANPEAAIAVGGQRSDAVARQAVRRCEGGEAAVLETGQPAAIGPDPESRGAILRQRPDLALLELARYPVVEAREPHAVEAGEPAARADPQVAVSRLDDGVDVVLREPVRLLPQVDDVLGRPLLGRRSGRPADRAGQQRQREDDADPDARHRRVPADDTARLHPKVSKADAKLNTHVVNNAMAQKMSGLWWLVSGEPDDRRAVGHHLATMDRYHLMPNGVHSGDEHYAGTNPSQDTELCAVVEGMFSVEQLLAILGDPALSDRLEKMTFNALPGTLDGDMWARMATADGGLVASAYGPSEVKTTVRGTVAVTLTEDTEYPFRDRIGIDVKNPARSPVVDWEVHPTTAWTMLWRSIRRRLPPPSR